MSTVTVEGGEGRLRIEVRPTVWLKVLAVSSLLFGALGVYGVTVPLQGDGPVTHFRCDRAADQCERYKEGQTPRPADHWKLSSIKKAESVGRGSRGNYRYDLDLTFASPARFSPRYVTISDRTAINGSAAEYRKAAAQINAFIDGTAPTLEVTYRYHPNASEVVSGFFSAFFGFALAFLFAASGASTEVVLDRSKGTAEVVRRRFLRPALRETVPLSDFTEIDERRFKVARPGARPSYAVEIARKNGAPLVLHSTRGPDSDLYRIEQGLHAFFGTEVAIKEG